MQRVREQAVQTVRKGRATNKVRAAKMNPFAGGVRRAGKGSIANAVGRGFTLTEVLIVAVIIGILLALVSAAVFPALDSAKEFARYSEAANLSMAMESFKAQYGATPPSNLSNANASEVYKFVSRTFPRFQYVPDSETQLPTNDPLTQANIITVLDNLNSEQGLDAGIQVVNTSDHDPGNALVFWLVGFSGDPSNPFKDHGKRVAAQVNSSPFYEFDTERLSGVGWTGTGTRTVRYYPNLPGGQETYHGDTDGNEAFLYHAKPYAASTKPAFTPYQKEGTTNYYNPRSFQIIQAGLDRQLGGGGPLTADSINDDNIASFASGTIRDFYEKNNN